MFFWINGIQIFKYKVRKTFECWLVHYCEEGENDTEVVLYTEKPKTLKTAVELEKVKS